MAMNAARFLLALTLPIALIAGMATVVAQDSGKKPIVDKPAPDPPKQPRMTLDLAGADCDACVQRISEALRSSGFRIDGDIKPESVGLVRIHVVGNEDIDLHAAATKVNSVHTNHPERNRPGLFFVLFARLDEKQADRALDVVTKMRGVDRKQTKADPKKGEISIKLAGEALATATERPTQPLERDRTVQLTGIKLTGPMFLKALKEVGVEAKYTAETPLISQIPQ
jgi:hypothetical protein